METLILTPQMHVDALAFELDQRLAARKLLRPQRQAASNRGWDKRRRPNFNMGENA